MQPPQHSITATPVLVLLSDQAWDHDKIDSETNGLTDEEIQQHPWAQYVSGSTRYDLHARCKWKGGEGCANDYLGDGALRFILKRHSVSRMAEIEDAIERELDAASARGGKTPALNSVFLKSAKHGIKEIQGDESIDGGFGASGVPDRILMHIVDHYGGLAAIGKIGAAAWHVSKPLSAAEKKR